MATIVKSVPVFEDSGFHLMARLMRNDGNVCPSGDFSAIDLNVFDIDRDWKVVDSSTLTIANVFFDVLQTDSRWTKDSTGYNFRHAVAASSMIQGDSTYRYEFKFTATSGAVVWVLFDVPTINLKRS
jgi:hypothetical protein